GAGAGEYGVIGGEVLQQREAVIVDVLLRAHHEAVAVLETPDAPGRAGVHIVHAFGLHARRVLQGDLPVRVAAVDDDVSGVAELDQLVDALRGGLAGRHHHPHDAGP